MLVDEALPFTHTRTWPFTHIRSRHSLRPSLAIHSDQALPSTYTKPYHPLTPKPSHPLTPSLIIHSHQSTHTRPCCPLTPSQTIHSHAGLAVSFPPPPFLCPDFSRVSPPTAPYQALQVLTRLSEMPFLYFSLPLSTALTFARGTNSHFYSCTGSTN